MSLKNLPDIEGIYSNWIDLENTKNSEERYVGRESYYHASGAGMCARKHYYSSTNHRETNPTEKKGMRVMRLGTVMHEDLQNAFRQILWQREYPNTPKEKESNKEKEIFNKDSYKYLYKNLKELSKDIKEIHIEGEIIMKELNVRGFYDMVIIMDTGEVYLYDFKTIGAYGYKLKFGRNPRNNDQDHQEMQLATYGMAVKEEFGRLDGMYLFYYNKDSSMLKQKIVPTSYLAKSLRYWKQVNAKMNMGIPPIQDGVSPAMTWECNYCRFKDDCYKNKT